MVPQGLILGILSFNIFLTELFFISKILILPVIPMTIRHRLSADNIDRVNKSLKEASEMFISFNDKLVKSNADKCNLLVSTNNTVKIKIGNFDVTNSKSEKL